MCRLVCFLSGTHACADDFAHVLRKSTSVAARIHVSRVCASTRQDHSRAQPEVDVLHTSNTLKAATIQRAQPSAHEQKWKIGDSYIHFNRGCSLDFEYFQGDDAGPIMFSPIKCDCISCKTRSSLHKHDIHTTSRT